MSDKNLKLKLEAVLDKVKSLANIKADIKALEARLSKIKIQGTLNSPATRKEINAKLKLFAPKVKVDADTTQAAKKLKKLGQQNSKTTIRPTVDNSQIASDLEGTQKITKSFFDKFSNGILGSNLIRMSIQNVIQSIHNAISNIKELDTIKANIQSASGAGETEADAMMSSYNYMAKQLSSTTKEVGEAANEFLRMGETVADTNALIKSSMVLSKVGMMGNSEAAGYLISSMKGYRTAAADSISIVDKLTAADAETAVSASGLAEALSKCSHAANSSGVTMDRLIGYAAAVGETTQKSMSEVGNSFQSIFSRINNIRIGRLVDDESGESLSDTEALLNKLGIQLRNSADIYRDFDSILDEIGKRWGNFTQAEQNSISTAIAGAKQRETFAALMDNYSDALNYSETAANSAGFALERYGVYQDSIEAKTNELTAAMEALSTNIITEDLFGGIIDASTGIVEFIDDTNLLKSTLAGFAAIKISKIFVSMAAGITTAIKSTKQLTAAMALFDKGKSTDNLKAIGEACKGLTDKQLKLVLSTKGLEHQERLSILAGKGVVEEEQEQTLATLGFSAAEDKASSSTFSLSGAMNALGTAFAMNPVGMTIGAIVIAATTMTAVLSLSSHAMEEIRQKAKELGDEFSSTQSDIDGYKTKIKELYAAIHDSHSSIEDVTAARKDLMAVQDELIKKFGDEEESVQSINEAINGQSDALDTLTQRQWQETKNEFNKNGFWNDLSNGVHGYSDNTDRMLKEYEGHVAKLDLSLFNGFLNENSKNYKEFKKLLKEDFGANITWGDRGNELAEISGNATEVYKKLLDLQNFSDQFNFTDGFSNHLTSLANSTKELSEQYKDFYNQYILYEKIFKEEDYADSFNNINDAYQQYQDAYASGDEEAIDNAAANFSSTLSEATKDVDDKSIVDYFNNMYPSMQAVIDKWEFKTKIIPSIDMEELRGKNQNDILKMIRTEGEEDAEKVFNSILEDAKEYGLINDINAEGIQKVLDLLVEWQILQGDIVSETAVKTPDFDSAAFTKVTKDLNSLSDIYQTFVSNMRKEVPTPVDASSLEALNETFGTLDGYQEFVTTLGSSSATADQAKASIAKLMNSYLQQNLRLDSCTKAQQKYVASQLQAIGIINSEELVTKELAFQEAESALRKYDLANASTEAMQSMLLEAQGASLTKGEIYSLAAAEIAYGNNGLDFSGKIEQLKVLAKAYGSTALEAMAATAADRVANNHGTYESVMDDLMAEWNKVKDSSEIKWEPVNIPSGASPKPAAQESEKEKDILSDLNSEMDKYQSKLKAVRDARETYNRHGRISLDQAQDILDADFKLLAAYGDEEAALESLGKAKLNEMQIQLARNAIHTINSITTEAAAVQYLAGANENLADATLDATEQALKQAVAFAKTRGDMQGAAAETILQGYQNGAQMLAQVDFSFDPSKAEKTALEKFKDWFSALFDWIETKLEKQAEKIEKYVSRAESRMDEGKYSSAAGWYKKAVGASAAQAGYQQEAGKKYKEQADHVLKKAVDEGVVSQDEANSIAYNVKNGSLDISEYSDEIKEVISAYREWYEKSREASEAIEDLHGRIREYVKALKDVRDAHRDAKIDSLELFTAIGTSASAKTPGMKNDQLYYQDAQLYRKNAAYDAVVKNMSKDTASLGRDAKSSVSAALKSGAENDKEYKKALNNAGQAVKSRKPVSDRDLNVIKKHSAETYSRLYAYNEALKNLDTARLEQAANYAATSAQIMANRDEKLENRRQDRLDGIDRLTRKSGGAASAAQANKLLDQAAAKYDTVAENADAAIKNRRKSINDAASAVSSKAGTTAKYKTLKSNENIKKMVNRCISQAKAAVGKGKPIPSAAIARLAKYYSEGYITRAFYESCVNYNNAMESLKQLELQKEIDMETAKAEKASIGTQKFSNVEKEHENRRTAVSNQTSAIKAAQDTKTARGLSLNASDYSDLINQSKSSESIYRDEAAALSQVIEENLAGGYWTKTSQEYLDAVSAVSDYKVKIQECQTEQEEFNNALAQLPYNALEKALELLDAIAANNKSSIDLKAAKGEHLSEADYLQQISDNNDQIKKLEEERLQAFADYQKALTSPDGVYGGKTAEEWKKSCLELDTQINNTLRDNESLKDSLRDDVYWRAFEQAHDSAARLRNILDGVSGLISDDMLFDSDGNLTDYGVAKTANLVGQYENARKEVQNYSNDIENLNKLYGEGKYTEEEYEEKLNELQSSMLDSAASMKNYSDSIIDMYKNMAQAELDELFKLIDARNDALNAKKAYYDYDKTIKSKTKDLQALRAQRAALEGVDTLEATARRALLTARIEEADADLNDTIMEHQFELSRDALNDLKETLQGAFDEEWENVHLDLDRIAELMSSANGLIESSADTVSSTIRTLLEHYGIDPSAPNHTAAGNAPDTGKAGQTGQAGTGGTESGASPAQGSPKPDRSKPTPIQSEPEPIQSEPEPIQSRSEQIQSRPEPIQSRLEPIQNRPAPIQIRPASIQGRNNTEPPSELMIRLDEMSVHMHPPVPPVLNTAIALPSGRENAGNTITQNYDSLIHIDGSVDTTTLEEMKRLSKDLLKQSCEFTSQSIYRGYIHSGGTRRV